VQVSTRPLGLFCGGRSEKNGCRFFAVQAPHFYPSTELISPVKGTVKFNNVQPKSKNTFFVLLTRTTVSYVIGTDLPMLDAERTAVCGSQTAKDQECTFMNWDTISDLNILPVITDYW
jgi:hypothetical protein